MPIEIKTYQSASITDPMDNKVVVAATFSDYPTLMGSAILNEIVRQIAEKFVEENYASLVSKLDQQAIANLAIADSGKKIAEEIRTRPVVYRERGNTFTRNSIF
jgi:hypothetical protein